MRRMRWWLRCGQLNLIEEHRWPTAEAGSRGAAAPRRPSRSRRTWRRRLCWKANLWPRVQGTVSPISSLGLVTSGSESGQFCPRGHPFCETETNFWGLCERFPYDSTHSIQSRISSYASRRATDETPHKLARKHDCFGLNASTCHSTAVVPPSSALCHTGETPRRSVIRETFLTPDLLGVSPVI